MSVNYDTWKTTNSDWGHIETSLCFQCANDEIEFKTGESDNWLEIENDEVYEFCCHDCMIDFYNNLNEEDQNNIIGSNYPKLLNKFESDKIKFAK